LGYFLPPLPGLTPVSFWKVLRTTYAQKLAVLRRTTGVTTPISRTRATLTPSHYWDPISDNGPEAQDGED
ncbi:MAG: hypothetical protein WB579_20655, partial [Bryobacteraceae bacterium]